MSDFEFFDRAVPPARSPSVPISVYRELAAELQATRVMLDSLHAQNQQLLQKNQHLSDRNQQLQDEIAKVARATDRIRHLARSFASHPEVEGDLPLPQAPFLPEPLVPETAVETEPSAAREGSDKPRPQRGGLLVLALVLAIALAAFGIGFVASSQR